ncbi:MAG TPA: DNA-binding protein WhiA [Ruminococcaceae bacterium]|nr:DNA-binding protein WhiA [Oscillospiraceae bacterium]
MAESFSAELKKELCNIKAEKSCCVKAQAYGMLLFGRHFSSRAISLHTENTMVAARYRELTQEVSGVLPRITSGSQVLECGVPEESYRRRVLSVFGLTGLELTRRINRANLENECCAGAFLRGSFLSCGSMMNPQKDYHLEFLVPRQRLSEDLAALLGELELSPKTAMRGGARVVYFKESERIEDLLTLMSAVKKSLELMDIKIYKDMRNRVNRLTNCETYNITKTVKAAVTQLEAIDRLEKDGRLRGLPEELYRIALIRRENPEASISELAALSGETISRSGINHRLKKLVRIAEEG